MNKENVDNMDMVLDEVPQGLPENSDFWRVTEMLLDENYKRRKTILSKRQVPKLTTIDVIAYIHDIPWLQQWVDKYTEYKTSLDGQRTKDIVGITKFNYAVKHGLQPTEVSDMDLDKKARLK